MYDQKKTAKVLFVSENNIAYSMLKYLKAVFTE
jgi:hypothetical protein